MHYFYFEHSRVVAKRESLLVEFETRVVNSLHRIADLLALLDGSEEKKESKNFRLENPYRHPTDWLIDRLRLILIIIIIY